MAVVGSIVVDIGANTAELRRELQRAQRRLSGFGRDMRRHINTVGKFGLAASAGAAAGVGALVAQSLKANDALAKTANRLGIATEELAGLRNAADLSGVQVRTLELGIQRMTRRVAEAASGTGEARDALKELGLDAQRLNSLSPDQAFREVAAAMEGVNNQSDRVRLAFKLFDSEGVALLNTLELGADGLDRAAEEARAFGQAISQVDAARIEGANDAMARVRQAFEGVITRLTVRLAPAIEHVANLFVEAAKSTDGFQEGMNKAFSSGLTGVKFVADAVQGLRVVFKGLEVIGKGVFATLLSGAELMARGVTMAIDGIIGQINDVIRAVNKIPGVDDIELFGSSRDSEFFLGLVSIAGDARDSVGAARDELHALAMQEMPSDQIDAFMADVEAAMERARAQTNETRRSLQMGGTIGDGEGLGEEGGEGDETRKNLDRVRGQLASEREAQMQHFAMQREILVQALEQNHLTESQFRELAEKAESEHLRKLVDIRKRGMSDLQRFNAKSWQGQVSQVAGSLEQMTAGVAQSNKTMFRINKVAGIANAVVNTAQGVTKALSAYPPPLSFAMAAAQAAAGAAQIAAIKSTSFSGGGSSGGASAPSVAGSTPAQPVSPTGQGGGRDAVIQISGTSFGQDQIRELAEGLGEFIQDNNGRIGSLQVVTS